ncbi:MAG TPA: Ku protein [Candidatus Binatia bacterium]|nr:Ku protein [Candidatus Binatia bacterium]
MPRRKSNHKKQRTSAKARSAGRPIWKGTINFGLVNIPVALYSAEADNSIDFDLLDKRDFSRVRYRRVNEKTGREVPWDEIVKGYEYKKGEYVALTDDDFLKANVEATQSIDIFDFVDAADISPIYFDKPYYLVPLKNGQRAYALLREVLRRTGKVGIARVVIRTRQHLAALLADGPVLILNLLRFSHELRDPSALDVPAARSTQGSNQELKMAEQLVETMAGKWDPKKYRDEYHQDLLQLIDKKIKSGQTKAIEPAEAGPRPKQQGKIIDIMHLLRQSVEQGHKKNEPLRRRKAS